MARRRPGDRSTWPQGHVMHMSLFYGAPAGPLSVAECDCGWEIRVPWPGLRHQSRQDAAIERHWRYVETRSDLAPAS